MWMQGLGRVGTWLRRLRQAAGDAAPTTKGIIARKRGWAQQRSSFSHDRLTIIRSENVEPSGIMAQTPQGGGGHDPAGGDFESRVSPG
jgi:hypothetical protein